MKVTRRHFDAINKYQLSWLGVVFVLGQVIGNEPPSERLSLNTMEGNDSVIVTFNGLNHKELLFASEGLYHSPVPFEREFEKTTTQVALLFSNGETISPEKLARTRNISSFHKTATRSHVVTASEILDIASSLKSPRQTEMSKNPLLILQSGMHKTVTPSKKDKENAFTMLKEHKITPSVHLSESVVTFKDGIKTPSSFDIKPPNLSGKQHTSEKMRFTSWFNALTPPLSHAISTQAFSKGQLKTDVAKITSETTGNFSNVVSTSYFYNSISSASLTYDLEHSRKPIISVPDSVRTGKSLNLSVISFRSKVLKSKLFSNIIVTATNAEKLKINVSATDLLLSSSNNYPHKQDLFVSKEASYDRENFLYTTEPLKILNSMASSTSRVTFSTIFGNLSEILNVNSAAGMSTLELSVSRKTPNSAAIHSKGKSPGTEIFPSPSTTRKNIIVSPSIFHGQISNIQVVFQSTASPVTVSREFRNTLSLLLESETVTDVKINNINSFQNILNSKPFITEIESASNNRKNLSNRTFTSDLLITEQTLIGSVVWKTPAMETVASVKIKNYTSVQNILSSQPFTTELESASNKRKNLSDRTLTSDLLIPELTLIDTAVWKNLATEIKVNSITWKKNVTVIQTSFVREQTSTDVNTYSKDQLHKLSSQSTPSLVSRQKFLVSSAVFAPTLISETSKTVPVLTNIRVDPTSTLLSKGTSSVVPEWLAASSLTTGIPGHPAMATDVFASLLLTDTTTSTTNILFPKVSYCLLFF